MVTKAGGVVLGILLLAAGVVLGRSTTGGDAGEARGSVLPRCSELPGEALGSARSNSSWNGCVTEEGAAMQSYVFDCEGFEAWESSSDDFSAAAGESVVIVPDAGLVGASGGRWRLVEQGFAATHRTPFAMLVGFGCERLRSAPLPGAALAGCNLDQLEITIHNVQGCESDRGRFVATGRVCTYPDWDILSSWEQWWIETEFEYAGVRLILETDERERWVHTRLDGHRDDRCSTAPSDWEADWRWAN